MRLQMVHVYRMPLCCLLGSNTCQISQNLHHFYAKAWHFEHLRHCMSFKRVPKPWVPLYIAHFLNILRAVCSWYLLPSCMVKLLILFPKEKLSRSMCKHSTWRPFNVHTDIVFVRQTGLKTAVDIKMESKSDTCFSLHGIEHEHWLSF